MWDRGLRVQNITFINFPSNKTRAIFGPIILGRCTYRCGVKNPSTTNTSIDIEISFRVYICPCYGCGCPTTTTTTATTATTTSATTTTATTATTTTATTTTSTLYLLPINPSIELPDTPQLCQTHDVRYWSRDADWTFGPQDYANWRGVKPTDGANVFVPYCITLIIDYPLPKIRSLKIEGIVEFEQGKNHVMYVDNIFIYGGRLIAGNKCELSKNASRFLCESLIGSPNIPFGGNIDIIITNSGPVNVALPPGFPAIGPRIIGVLGSLDLHGTLRGITWTRLAATAISGQRLITLSTPVTWIVGDEIIITTTDKDISHTERHRIANIENGTVIRTEVALAYTHNVLQQIFPNGEMVTVAAASVWIPDFDH
ncbi:unnamed protein product [Rotaria sp. Silwood2]|nr:unnamed protein product [Rotaria sp. Silwood2]